LGKQVFDCEAVCIGSVTENEAKTSILVIFSYVDRVRESILLKMGRYKFTENLKEKAKTEDEKRR